MPKRIMQGIVVSDKMDKTVLPGIKDGVKGIRFI